VSAEGLRRFPPEVAGPKVLARRAKYELIEYPAISACFADGETAPDFLETIG
jgi:hypothetical protein